MLIALVCVDGLSYKEAAEVLEIPIGTVIEPARPRQARSLRLWQTPKSNLRRRSSWRPAVAKVTDEMLMAYADGALALLLRGPRWKLSCRTDPEARRRVEIFRATGAPLSKLYGQPMSEPVPAHLRDFVLNYPLCAETPRAQRQKRAARVG